MSHSGGLKSDESIELMFRAPLIEGQYKLMEVSEEMLKQIQSSTFDPIQQISKDMIEFRGATTDEAALVTRDKTYSVRLVESSNTQLLVSTNPAAIFVHDPPPTIDESPNKKQKLDSSHPNQPLPPTASTMPIRMIEGTVQHHYEAIEILPRIHILRDLLNQRLYGENEEEERAEEEALLKQQREEAPSESKSSAPESSDDIDMTVPSTAAKKFAPLYKLIDLQRLIQASDQQLREGLAELEAFEDERGYMRMLDPDFTAKVFDSLCLFWLVEMKHEEVTKINLKQCQEGLDMLYPPLIIAHVLRIHSKPVEEGQDPNCQIFTLDLTKVCLFHARRLFSQKQPYPHLAFLKDWQAAVPAGMKVDPTILRGHALCELASPAELLARGLSGASGSMKPSNDARLQWRYYPVHLLSPQPKTRFAQLFDTRPKWTLQEIEPYIWSLCTPGQTIEQLLLKQTRPITSMENGVKTVVYTRR